MDHIYTWCTDYCHCDNTYTMSDYIECELEDGYYLIYQDGAYAEFVYEPTMKIYEAHTSGNGDFNNHKIEFKEKIKNG